MQIDLSPVWKYHHAPGDSDSAPPNLRAREANVGSFGENLRREREMRGVDLREIADATKINLRFLEAVENEEFGALPGGVFNRGGGFRVTGGLNRP